MINDILLARVRMAEARNQLVLAGAHALAIKEERQENRLAIRSAQRQVTVAKKEFTRAGEVLAKMEKKYMDVLHQMATKRKPAPARLAAITSKETKLLGFRLPSPAVMRLLKKRSTPLQPPKIL